MDLCVHMGHYAFSCRWRAFRNRTVNDWKLYYQRCLYHSRETVSYSITLPPPPRGEPVTYNYTASNSESADPNVYQTYNDIEAGFSPNGNGTFTLDVVPGVTVCGTACHVSALGFPPTVTFYYSLQGSGTWQSYSQVGTDLSEFFITLPQAGTYDYYTQEDTAPGVLSGELGSGSVTVQ